MTHTDAADPAHPTLTPEESRLTPAFVRDVVDALDRGARADLRAKLSDLRAADLADLFGLIGPEERRTLVDDLGTALAPEVLSELDPDVRDEVLHLLAPAKIAEAIQALDTDDAVYLIEDLDAERQRAVLQHVPDAERAAVELSLQYADNTAGRLMQREVVCVPPYWTVGQTIDHLRESDDLPTEFFEIYVVDPAHQLLGTVPLDHLVRTKRPAPITEIMEDEPTVVPVTMDQEEVAYLFEQYRLVSAPVVDENKRLAGMITVDDIVEVIQEEVTEDMLALGGVRDDEGMTATVVETARNRFSWLFVNLLTAILASAVIALFDGTIEQIVQLAVLMPIVASMGGNAGTQTLTVAVRAMATRDLNATNAVRIVWREVLVGGINGLAFAVIMGTIGGLWAQSYAIGIVLAAAMVINVICAGFAGILIPLGLERAGVDPAVSSTVFLTTVTDCVGFFVFLGLATWYLSV